MDKLRQILGGKDTQPIIIEHSQLHIAIAADRKRVHLLSASMWSWQRLGTYFARLVTRTVIFSGDLSCRLWVG